MGFLALQNAVSFIAGNNLVIHTRDVLREITGSQAALTAIQTGHEGYLLTDRSAYLVGYQVAAARLVQRQETLRRLTADNADLQSHLDELQPLTAEWLALVGQSVAAQQAGQSEAARTFFTTAEAASLLDQINNILTHMSEHENQLLQERTQEAARQAQFTLATFFLLIGIMIALLGYGYYLISRDLARRREFDRLLRRERTLLRGVIDTVPEYIHVKDNEQRFILVNRAQADLMGAATPDAVIGKRDGDYFPAAMAAGYDADEKAILETGAALLEREEPSLGADGQMRVMLTTKVPVRSSAGEIIQIVGISRDITARKQTEQAIEALNQHLSAQTAQLESANKELEAFSYSVSHDLRAPLRAIDGFSRIVIEEHGLELPPDVMRYLQKVRANSQRMGELIDDLLHFSRLSRQQLNKKTVYPADLARQILDDDLREERENRQIEINIDDMPPVQADPLLLRQLYANLLSNALKFTSKCESARIDIGSQQADEEIVYFVKDNGAGFDPQYKAKLFGVFQRLHRVEDYGGTGVGLAIVQRVAMRHGGRAWAEGAVNQGAVFYFTLGENNGESDGANPAG